VAIIGLFVRTLIWLAAHHSEDDKKKGGASGKVQREHRASRPSLVERPKNVAVGLATVLLLFFAVTSTPSSADDQASEADAGLTKVVYVDPLTSPSPAWPQDPRQELPQRGYARFFAARTYHIAVQQWRTKVDAVATDPHLRSLGDVKVQVSARVVSNGPSGQFGLLCRHQRDRYYAAIVSDGGRLSDREGHQYWPADSCQRFLVSCDELPRFCLATELYWWRAWHSGKTRLPSQREAGCYGGGLS
jgi:hypothetical protein